MKRTTASVKVANQLSGGVVPFLMATIAMPILVLVGFGLYAIYQNGYTLYFMAFLALSALLSVIPVMWLKRKARTEIDEQLNDSLVQASNEWGEFDQKIWYELNDHILSQLEQSSEWEGLKEHGLELITLTSAHYHHSNHRKELAFSAPELLKMIEEISRRYRYLLKSHVPMVEKINISTFKLFYDHKEKAEVAKKVWDVYRAYRAFTPTGLIAELRGQVLGKVFDDVGDELQAKLKQALLQEVLSVAIDLYSGRFVADDDELEPSKITNSDQNNKVAELEPLRVCLLGQVSSGKSTLVNVLTNNIAAEVSLLPATDAVSVHQCMVDGIEAMNLVDLPGVDGKEKTHQRLVEQVANSDLVLWVLKADQPARSLDTDFLERLNSYYLLEKNRSRKKPTIIGVLNQVDRLKPVREWQPPYDLTDTTSSKVNMINEATEYNRELLNFEHCIPLSVSENKPHFNLEQLTGLLDSCYEQGIQTQLNRRRMEAGDKLELTDQAKRVYQAGKSLFSLVSK